MTKKLRVAVVVSALWVAGWTFVVLQDRSFLSHSLYSGDCGLFSDDCLYRGQERHWAKYFGITYFPLLIAWGVWWIRRGE